MIYLDSAATTLQKPLSVAYATSRAIRDLASPGRGGYGAAMNAAKLTYDCREMAADLFHVPNPEQVVFTFNATHGLNIAIRTLVKPGSRVIISGYEHNAVTRPLAAIPDVILRIARSSLFDQTAIKEAFRKELEQGADVAICTHVSNVFGYILPIEEIADLCREKNIPLIVDASQSAGCIPVDFQALGAAFVAMPGHKGLYGPQGTGLLLCNRHPEPILRGGTGSESLFQEMPDFLPDRLEAGTHNMPGVAGLMEGLRYLQRRGIESIRAHEQNLVQQAGKGLAAIEGVQTFLSSKEDGQSGVLSFRMDRFDCEELGQRLGEQGFALRAGLHCAPLAHQSAGTLETGTVRLSVSDFNTEREISLLLRAVAQLAEHG